MAIYRNEWPLLVLSPSGARYHWESEFQNWLGVDSAVNKPDDDNDDTTVDKSALLKNSQINVLGSSKDPLLPSENTRVVICSYGLVSVLVESGKLTPGMFPCAIVDESHMLKNKSSKRTSSLIPVLKATKRCVLLSGTPAFARPAELWPQLQIIGTEQHGWWDNEEQFMDKYAKPGRARRLAELHTMLTGTVMIRRLKADILKSLPKKIREKAAVHVLSQDQRREFKELLAQLRRGKGTLGKIAREEHASSSQEAEQDIDAPSNSLGQVIAGLAPEDPCATETAQQRDAVRDAKAALQSQIQRELREGQARVHATLAPHVSQLAMEEYGNLGLQLEGKLRTELETKYREGVQAIESRFSSLVQRGRLPESADEIDNQRTNVLSRLYELSGKAKIPLMVDMLKRWLRDPLKGKLCIFAHHISVLDAVGELAGLSNEKGSSTRFIRIDGSTSPKQRQQQIKDFQSDPSIRIALLGITAAGVAVTLTASSTVWFAELFWTPAIMIQAEDRYGAVLVPLLIAQTLFFHLVSLWSVSARTKVSSDWTASTCSLSLFRCQRHH